MLNNTATQGGGIFNSGTNPTLVNCSLQGNSATDGGGIYNGGSNATLINCSLLNNSASSNGGGIYNGGSNPVLVNCVLWNNGGSNTISNNSSSVTATYSLFDNTVAGYTGTNNKTTTTSPFALAGVTLALNSPAIDAGDNQAYTTANGPATDLAGNPRTVNGKIDMGAIESQTAPTPTGPATLTISSFTCFSTAGALSSVNFVVGYSDGTFTPALPPLFILGVTANGQLGQSYGFGGFDVNASTLPIANNSNRQVYFVWDFRAACAGPSTPVTPPAPTAPVAPALPNQTATQGTFFSYVVPAFTGTAPIGYAAASLPDGLSFNAGTRTISGTPTTVQTPTVTISATNAAGTGSGQFTIAVSASAVTPIPPTGPATLTITSFTCFSTNGALSSVNFVVGYSDGTFTPALPPLFIVGVTANGQLGQPYNFGGFDANASALPIADNANRQVYFVWDFRAACAGPSTPVMPPAPTAPVAPALPNQTATQGTPFSYVVPAFTGTGPISYAAASLPDGLSFNAGTRTISGTPTTVQTSTVTISATNAAGTGSGQFTIAVNPAPVTPPTGPATLTITSFNCFSTAGVLSSVNFVVGYSNGTFTPALPPLFIIGVTVSGQLGQPYSFSGFDANTNALPIADNANRQVYFVWNFRQACANSPSPGRVSAEVPLWQVTVLDNPTANTWADLRVGNARGASLQVRVSDAAGHVVSEQTTSVTDQTQTIRAGLSTRPGIYLIQVSDGGRQQTLRVLRP